MTRLVIDQSAITAPNFPRTVEWWCGFLPSWLTFPDDAEANPYQPWDMSTIEVDDRGRVLLTLSSRYRTHEVTDVVARMLGRFGVHALSIEGGAAS